MLNIRIGGCRQVIVIASHRPDDYTRRIKRPADTAKLTQDYCPFGMLQGEHRWIDYLTALPDGQ